MNPFREIEAKSSDLLCPACGTCSISVFLRRDESDRECITVASCGRCGALYDAEILPTFLEQYEAVCIKAEQEPCPACASRSRVVRSLCDRHARECFFLFACQACGDVRIA